jgi:transposase-like protein
LLNGWRFCAARRAGGVGPTRSRRGSWRSRLRLERGGVEVARRHGVSPQQVTAWRRQARQGRLALPAEEETAFAGLLVEDARPAPSVLAQRPIEIEADGGSCGSRQTRRRRAMIVPAQAVRVAIATRPIDFRRGHDSLAAYVQNELKLDPHSGALHRLPLAAWRPDQGSGLERERAGSGLQASGRGQVRLAGDPGRGDAAQSRARRSPVRRTGLASGLRTAARAPAGCGGVTYRPREGAPNTSTSGTLRTDERPRRHRPDRLAARGPRRLRVRRAGRSRPMSRCWPNTAGHLQELDFWFGE